MNHQPHLFAENNQLARTDARYVLENYLHLIRWKSKEPTILDIGCGDGGNLRNVLVPNLPQNYKKIYGIDISNEFVEYATKHNTNDRIVFEQFDISSKQLPIEYCERFDYIFSFHCLQWVIDQKEAIENIYKMLTPEGDTLFVLLATFTFFEIYEVMYTSSKWSKYMDDIVKFISPYHRKKQGHIEMENLLKRQGFINTTCRLVARSFTFPNAKAFLRLLVAVNPFVPRIPQDQLDEYNNDCINVARKLKSCTFEAADNDNDEGKVTIDYEVLVAYAVKPAK